MSRNLTNIFFYKDDFKRLLGFNKCINFLGIKSVKYICLFINRKPWEGISAKYFTA